MGTKTTKARPRRRWWARNRLRKVRGESRSAAIVRTFDRGVGMGVEFTGLDQAIQKRLQQQVESIAVESAEIVSGAEITDVWMHR